MNHTGDLPAGGHRAKIHSLYEFPDGSPIMNRTEVIDTDTFRIHLNDPYTQLLAAMAYVSCDILSPTSTPFDTFLDKATDDLVGTGPYMYDYYIADTEVRFTRWDEYWGSPANTGKAYFEVMIFDVIDDSTTRNYAMLAGDCDYLSGSMADLFDDFRAAAHITFFEDPNLVGIGISYLGMNNDVLTIAEGDSDDYVAGLNLTWRKAITFAINNTYMTEEMYDGMMVRAYCWISPGYGDFFDTNLATYAGTAPDEGDIIAARQIIKDDLGPVNADVAGRNVNTDADWEVDPEEGASSDNWIISFNYSYNTDNWFRADLYEVLLEWLGQIGIFVIDGGTDWAYFLYRAYGYVPGGYDQLQIYWVGWGPDYLDPMNMIQPLISNVSQSNSAQVNDPTVEAWIETYNKDVTLTYNERKWIIWNLTYHCTQVGYYHVYGFHAKIFSVHASDLYNVPYNTPGNFWAYPIQRFNYSAYEVTE
jgi:ABC-type transport system substrate-binding protein